MEIKKLMSAEELSKMTTEEKVDHILETVDEISRGLYGDNKNKIPGVIDNVATHHTRLKSLEESRKKVLYWLGGASAVIIMIVEVFHWLTH